MDSRGPAEPRARSDRSRDSSEPGDYPNQGQTGEGLTAYAAGAEGVDGQDLVVWHTTGFTHHPTVEEYPVMTTDRLGFRIAPNGFFDGNPALGAPIQAP